MSSHLIVDPQLLRKYGGPGPRYTSYPTADRFVEAYDADSHLRALSNRCIGGLARPLTLYVHHPFCDTVCYYCACNKIVTRNHERAEAYVEYLRKEAALVAAALGDNRQVRAMHWGGGTPTFMGMDCAEALMRDLAKIFRFDPSGEYSIEIDPRRVSAGDVQRLAAMGFNRASLGVQDFDHAVQKAVNRIQSVGQTRAATDALRQAGMRSVNFDLIVGLPRQTLEGFGRTLEQVIECAPDRIALYSYAHLPQLFKPQRRIVMAELPDPQVKQDIILLAIAKLQAAGYEYIGMDHFARPDDELAQAQRQGRLQRDFQGYSVGDCDTVGLGVSAISSIGPYYGQNHKDIADYYGALDAGHLPVARGLELSADDLVRRAVIRSLACQFVLSKETISVAHLVDFDHYFEAEAEDLCALEADGLIENDEQWITVTPRGRLLVRSICMVFDRYLRTRRERERYSRVM